MTLTYNQQKTFSTSQGGICSVITGIILLYNFAILALNYLIENKYRYTERKYGVDLYDPETYNLTSQEWNVLTSITSYNSTFNQELEKYVGGVYVETIGHTNGTIEQNYIESIKCSEMSQNLSKSFPLE